MIHPTAIVDPAAELAADVKVGPWSIIGPGVEIGAGTEIASHVVIEGPTRIGRNNRIFQFASVGAECQDKKYRGEPTRLEIGDDNVIREHVTIHRGTIQDNSLTRIGDRNLLMVAVHVAHDCVIGSDNVFAMSAGCSLIVKDIPAYVMVGGNPASARSMNFEGMRRRGWSADTISSLRQAYKIVYRQGLTLEQAIAELEAMPASAELQLFIDSLRASERGITR